jgi:hypothetical protein
MYSIKVKVMKKIIISAVSVLLLIFSSCYNDDKNAIVRINLGSIPIAKQIENKSFIDKLLSVFVKDAYAQNLPEYGIIKIHLAAYRGSSRIAQQSFETTGMNVFNNMVEFSIPAGDNLNIVVFAERYEGSAPVYNDISYYGKTDNDFNIKAGEEKNILIVMSDISNALGLSYTVVNMYDHKVTWNPLLGSTKYILESNFNSDYTLRYTGQNTSYNVVNGVNDTMGYRLHVEFDHLNKVSSYAY